MSKIVIESLTLRFIFLCCQLYLQIYCNVTGVIFNPNTVGCVHHGGKDNRVHTHTVMPYHMTSTVYMLITY